MRVCDSHARPARDWTRRRMATDGRRRGGMAIAARTANPAPTAADRPVDGIAGGPSFALADDAWQCPLLRSLDVVIVDSRLLPVVVERQACQCPQTLRGSGVRRRGCAAGADTGRFAPRSVSRLLRKSSNARALCSPDESASSVSRGVMPAFPVGSKGPSACRNGIARARQCPSIAYVWARLESVTTRVDARIEGDVRHPRTGDRADAVHPVASLKHAFDAETGTRRQRGAAGALAAGGVMVPEIGLGPGLGWVRSHPARASRQTVSAAMAPRPACVVRITDGLQLAVLRRALAA